MQISEAQILLALVSWAVRVRDVSQALLDFEPQIEFAIGFYTALGAGKSIEFSYQIGCSAIRLAGIPEHLTPVLKKKQ